MTVATLKTVTPMVELAQLLIYGVVLGSIIALGAIGVSLTFGVLRFANFAHGDYMTVGAYLVLPFYAVLQLPMFAAVLIAIAGTALMAVTIDRLLFERLRQAGPLVLLISSFGVGLMLRSVVQMVWGPRTLVYESGIDLPLRLGALRIKPDHLTIIGGALLLVLTVHLLLTRTRIGKAMRAMSDSPELARVSGINTAQVILFTWVAGAALAATAGFFLALDTTLLPGMGWFFLLPVFAAAILGGIGRPYGAIIGGYVIGITAEFSTLFISAAYKPAVAFAIMVAILILRPTGILRGN